MYRIPCLPVLAVSLFTLAGCIVQHETPLAPDAKADERLEGVWKYTTLTEEEEESEKGDGGVGAGYLIFSKVDEKTYKVQVIDQSVDADLGTDTIELLVSTNKRGKFRFLSARLPDREQKRLEIPKGNLHHMLVDYRIDEKGLLFLRYPHDEDFQDAQEIHPMKHVAGGGDTATITLQGTEEEILGLYTDPKVRAILTSCGKYRKLVPEKR